MKRKEYIELTREQSLQRTFEICMKYATDKSQMERIWANRPIWIQHEIETETNAIDVMGWEDVQEKNEEVLAV